MIRCSRICTPFRQIRNRATAFSPPLISYYLQHVVKVGSAISYYFCAHESLFGCREGPRGHGWGAAHEGLLGCPKGLWGHGWGGCPRGSSWARLNLGVDFLIFGRANLAPKFLIPTFSYSSPWVYNIRDIIILGIFQYQEYYNIWVGREALPRVGGEGDLII